MRIHLDTDLGGDPDDACALAMLLGWQGVEIVGITTVLDRDGRRASLVAHVLELVDRGAIPVVAGAGASLTTQQSPGEIPDDGRYWPVGLAPRPSAAGDALDLLERSIDQGATVVAIGPYTNLALLEVARPGRLAGVPVVLMGGWVYPPAHGLPSWGPEMDWNVQYDTLAARIVAEQCGAPLTLATLPVTLQAHLRARDVPRIVASGALGDLLARQGTAHAEDHKMRELGRAHVGLPDDLLNFHYDPVACAVAAGWSGAVVEDVLVRPQIDGDVLRFVVDDQSGRSTRVVVDIDGGGFCDLWLTAVARAQPRT